MSLLRRLLLTVIVMLWSAMPLSVMACTQGPLARSSASMAEMAMHGPAERHDRSAPMAPTTSCMDHCLFCMALPVLPFVAAERPLRHDAPLPLRKEVQVSLAHRPILPLPRS
ncbi:hypothetical protein ACQ3G6_00755 [Allorhizobium undicola]|uniref:hypothetical protein n=1 Tax=Allorhizobium undicola TaxID=78527 RepID=UPI003D33B715